MNVPEFQAKWHGSTLKERSAAQEHFLDLCRVLGMPTPAEADKTGAFYTFEKGATKTKGGQGFADVWWDGRFAWEYKGHRADLKAAYQQLLQYREDLGNPPLLVVCDLDRFEVHTNFTGTKKFIHAFTVADLDQPAQSNQRAPLDILRAVFSNPEALRPGQTVEDVTVEAAARFATLAAGLQSRGVDPHRAAHYLVQLLFCLFAEDVGLLSRGIFTNLLAMGSKRPEAFTSQVAVLLAAMRDGGAFGVEWINRFNGGLFATIDPAPLTASELSALHQAAALDWGAVEPAIFGTLFERSLDPSKRSQLGAHYTGRADIERVVEPVVMTPLRRRWDQVKAEAETLRVAWEAATTPRTRDNRRAEFSAKLHAFQQELTEQRVLDPACGSGNFLYVALTKLLDLEKEVLVYGAASGLPLGYPLVSPRQLFGLEINEYARELAQVVVWIGYLQWRLGNGFSGLPDPILEPLETIKLQDALLDLSDPANLKEAEWPAAEFIIGNPPFLGDKKMRRVLGSEYLHQLRDMYSRNVPGTADLCCYFFEHARQQIASGRARRAGLLATNSIRGGSSREILDRIKESGDIFAAWDDEPWILDGAQVRISIVAFDDGTEQQHLLDGHIVSGIHSNLTTGFDASHAHVLPENASIGYIGVQPSGPFVITEQQAKAWLRLPANVNGRPNADVLRPFVIGADVLRRGRNAWIIDFGPSMSEAEAAEYEAPFEYARQVIKPIRESNNRERTRTLWWIHGESRPGMRVALSDQSRYLVSPIVAKHRIFAWLSPEVLPGNKCVAFAREDDYFLGVLQSRAHETWAVNMATRHGVGNDPAYHVRNCFETFPLPWSPGEEPNDDPRFVAIAAAAKALDSKRQAWLNPPDATPDVLKKRTLTNLYNERPTWLAMLHADLDRAVWNAYGWDDADPSATSEDSILSRLLALNGERSSMH